MRPVVRYLITRFEPFWSEDGGACGANGSQKLCEVESEEMAESLSKSLNDMETERLRGLQIERVTSLMSAEQGKAANSAANMG